MTNQSQSNNQLARLTIDLYHAGHDGVEHGETVVQALAAAALGHLILRGHALHLFFLDAGLVAAAIAQRQNVSSSAAASPGSTLQASRRHTCSSRSLHSRAST